jgi:hypothetical protein
VPIICDFYFVREHPICSDEQKAAFRVAFTRTAFDDPQGKRHLSELNALAEGASIPSPDVSGSTGERSANWSAIQIIFLSDFKVQITTPDGTYPQNYGELGFADRRAKRGEPKPSSAWLMFRVLAESGGIIKNAGKVGKDWPKVEKRMQEIRNTLRNHFGIAGDPIPFIKGTGYKARFKVSCSPSYRT